MKKLKLVLGGIIMYSSLGYGQTNVIALKSHSGNTDELLNEKDNFGDHPGMWLENVDSVQFIPKEKVVIQYRTSYFNKGFYTDTFDYRHEDEKAIQEHLKAIRLNNWYPEKTKFIDFPEEVEKMAKEQKNVKQNGLSFWLLFTVLGLVGLNQKKIVHNKTNRK